MSEMNKPTGPVISEGRRAWMLFYPEISAAGGLAAALLTDRVDSEIPIETKHDGLNGYATVAFGRRSVTVACAVQKRLFIVQFTCDGTVYAKIGLDRLPDLRRAVNYWLIDKVNLATFKTLFETLDVLPQGLAFEAGRGTEYQWETLLAIRDPVFKPLVLAAAAESPLRKLFPFRSGHTFRFSRTAGWPFTFDSPYLRTPDPSVAWYQAMAAAPHLSFPEAQAAGTVLREGTDALEVVAALLEAMPHEAVGEETDSSNTTE